MPNPTPTAYTAEVRRGLVPFTLAKLVSNSAYRFATPFLATIASGLNVSLSTIGTAVAVGELGGLAAPLLSGVTHRISHRASMISGLFALAAGATACAASRTVVQFALSLFLLTSAQAFFNVGASSWLAARVPYNQLGRAIGITETSWAGSLFIGLVLMGLLTQFTSWRWGYMLAVAAILILIAVVYRTMSATDPAPLEPALDAHLTGRSKVGPGWWLLLSTFTLMGATQCVFVVFGKWLTDEYGFDDANIAALSFALGGAELAAMFLTVRFMDRLGKSRAVIVGASCIVPAALILALPGRHLVLSLVALAIYIGAFEFAIVATIPMAGGLLPDRPSMGLALRVCASTLGRAVFAAPATIAYERHGVWLPAVMGATCAAVTIGTQLRYRVLR
jgi:MFS transporter, DHA1 family, inner membrane transport protein